MKKAPALPRALLPDGQKPGDARPRWSIGRIQDEATTARQIDACARYRSHPSRFLRLPGAHDASDGADVTYPESGIAEQGCG